MKPFSLFVPAVATFVASGALAAEVPAAVAPSVVAAAPSVAGGLAQVVFGLVVVLGLILATAWIGRRMGLAGAPRGHVLNIVASAAVGPRERVVVVEAGEQWLVVGVAPGNVNHIATLPRGETPAPAAASPTGNETFAMKLAQKLVRPHAR